MTTITASFSTDQWLTIQCRSAAQQCRSAAQQCRTAAQQRRSAAQISTPNNGSVPDAVILFWDSVSQWRSVQIRMRETTVSNIRQTIQQLWTRCLHCRSTRAMMTSSMKGGSISYWYRKCTGYCCVLDYCSDSVSESLVIMRGEFQ